jgi:glycosyltransferase involved in cell wall biosynthesis
LSARVLHVFSTFAPGGPQVRAVRLLPELDPSWSHAILALDGDTRARELLPAGVAVEVLPSFPKAGTPRTAWTLARLLRRLRPDLLLSYNFGALDALLAARLAPPGGRVHHEDGFLPDEVRAFKRRRVWLRRLLLPGTDALIVPSHTLEAIARDLWRLAPERVRRIPNGIRLADFAGSEARERRRLELGVPAGAPLVGWVGHLRPEKNPVRAVEAFALAARTTEDAHLLLLGDGPERAAVERAVGARGLVARVHRVGHRSDPRADYQAMDVLLLSSDTEQMPVALLEAMAAGLPVVATDVGDVRAVLPAAQQRFVVAGAPERATAGLAAGLGALALDAEERARLGRENRARVEAEYSFEAMARAYRACYSACLRARGAG